MNPVCLNVRFATERSDFGPSSRIPQPSNSQGCVTESDFGRAAKKAHFLLSEEWTFVNHGAFGSPLAAAFEAAVRELTPGL
jgi:hypothetical protein